MSEFNEDDFFNVKTTKKNNDNRPTIISLNEVLNLADTPIPWLINDLLIQGGCSLLAAKPKVGKTTLSRCLALAVSRGASFFGKPTHKSKVLMISLEDKLSEVGRHFRLLGANNSDNVFVLTQPPKNANFLREIINQNSFGLVIIDTLVLGVQSLVDINDYLQVSQAIAPYVQIARETNSHLMFSHHLSKKERAGGDQILGSTALFGSVDVVMLLDRQKQRRVFSTIARYGSDWAPATIELQDSGDITLVEEADDSIRQQVLFCISSSRKPLTEKEITALVYGRTSEKRKELRSLIQTGLIIRHGTGSKNSPFLYSSRP